MIKIITGLILISEDDWMINSRDSNGTSSFHSFSLDYPKYAVYRKVKLNRGGLMTAFLFFFPFLESFKALYVRRIYKRIET